MKKQRIVIALGGNALGENLTEQYIAVQSTAKVIADLIEEGHEVLITHGNGPQVGMIQSAMDLTTPLSVCVAMSQAYIGYDLQNALREELLNRGIQKSVSTVLTQVCVDEKDPAFLHPTKSIGFTNRRLVASPRPLEIVELPTIRHLLDAGQIVVTCGGGGIPVIRKENHLKGVSAVIDKDFASALLAKQINADILIILTAVEKVAIYFGTEKQKWLDTISVDEAKRYINEGHFAPGSMLPKIQAGMEFVLSGPNKTALITLLTKAREGIHGLTGTRIL